MVPPRPKAWEIHRIGVRSFSNGGGDAGSDTDADSDLRRPAPASTPTVTSLFLVQETFSPQPMSQSPPIGPAIQSFHMG